MSTFFRRAGSRIAKFLGIDADPPRPATGQIVLYAKDSGGTLKLFTRDSAGTVSGVGASEFSGVSAFTSVQSTISQDTWSAIAYNNVPPSPLPAVGWVSPSYDVGGYHSNDTNPSRFYAPAAGYYHITAGCEFPSCPEVIAVAIVKNWGGVGDIASHYLRVHFLAPRGNNEAILSTAVTAYLAEGDYVECVAYGYGGTVQIRAPYFAPFTMCKVG